MKNLLVLFIALPLLAQIDPNDRTRYSARAEGATAGARIISAASTCPNTGCVIDSGGEESSPVISSDIFSGIIKPITWYLSSATWSITHSLTVPATVTTVITSCGTSLSHGANALTFNGPFIAPDCQVITGAGAVTFSGLTTPIQSPAWTTGTTGFLTFWGGNTEAGRIEPQTNAPRWLFGLDHTVLSTLKGSAIFADTVAIVTDPDNGSVIDLGVQTGGPPGAGADLSSGKFGAGSYLPLRFWTGGVNRLQIDSSGNIQAPNNTPLQWKDAAGSYVASLQFDGSNIFSVGQQTSSLAASATNFWANGVRLLVLATSPNRLAPQTDLDTILGDSTHRYQRLYSGAVQIDKGAFSDATLLIESNQAGAYVNFKGASEGAGNSSYSLRFPQAGPGAANKILVTSAGTDNEFTWQDLPAGNSWLTNGNTIGGGSFLFGTNDNNPVELEVNGIVGFRLEANAGNPRLLGGLSSSDASTLKGSIVTKDALVSVTAATNASVASLAAVAGNYVALGSNITGAGTYLPLVLFTSGARAVTISTTAQQYSSGSTPTISACGAGATVAAGSDDNNGVINVGTLGGSTSCTINFAHTWDSVPICVANADGVGQAVGINAPSTTQVTFGINPVNFIYYHCQGHK